MSGQASAPHNILWLALSDWITAEISAEHLLGRIVDLVVDLTDADRGSLFLVDRAGRELVSAAAHLPELDEIRVPLSEGVAGHVARTGETVRIDRADDDDRFFGEVDEETGYQTRSMLAVPLSDARDRRMGVLQLLNKKQGSFTESDGRRIEEFGRQIAELLEQTTLPMGRVGGGRSPSGPDEWDGDDEAEVDDDLPLGQRFNRVIGQGRAMRDVLSDVDRVAGTDVTVLLLGESGTGKTLIARALHHNSPRGEKPFVHVDCTTLPETLIENELFGHEEGAYTGADTSKPGRVQAAEGGTLFLDEIGDLPPRVQGKLLTLIQDHSFSPVGSTERQEADIRVVAATNRNLAELVDRGEFREDLFYRLRVVQIEMPPLRQRGRSDLRRLIEHFVERAADRHDRPVDGITDEAWTLLMEYRWPGNVRELENCLESAVIFADGYITPESLPLPGAGAGRSATGPASFGAGGWTPRGADAVPEEARAFADEPTLERLEARYIAWLLERHDGNRSQCARILGIGRNTLLRKIRKYDLE